MVPTIEWPVCRPKPKCNLFTLSKIGKQKESALALMFIRGRQLSQFSPMRSCLRALLQEAGLKKTHTTSEA